jgi:GxxExxY protein
MGLKHSDITQGIIECYYSVYNELGYGFLEKVYEKAMEIELKSKGFGVEIQKPIQVYYKDQSVGNYFADMVVEGLVILELKAASNLMPQHEAQLINYLKATNIEVGLLLNFGLQPEFKRKIYTNK